MTAPPPAAIERLLAEEPFLRRLARDLHADEADDLVQATWLRALSRRGGGTVHDPRAWLARVARRLASNARRAAHRRRARERTAATPVPTSAELSAREERRHELLRAVDALPPGLRAVVVLRYLEGLPPRRVAIELGLPVTTVWNRLRDGLRILRRQLDEQGDRRAWLAPLLPAAMSVPGKVGAAAVAVALVAVAALTFWGRGAPALPPSVPPAPLAGQRDAAERPQPSSPRADRTIAADAPPVAATGALAVEVVYANDGAPAADVQVCVAVPGTGDATFAQRRVRTDARGRADFGGVPPGPCAVDFNLWPERARRIDVVAGETATLRIEAPVGVTVRGIVVDPDGRGVPGAEVHLGPMAQVARDIERAAFTDAAGEFTVRSAPTMFHIGARAAGWVNAPLQFLHGSDAGEVAVRIELADPGGTVSGRVVDGRGAPVAAAMVWVGEGWTRRLAGISRPTPWPTLAFTDGDGRFRAEGVAPGDQPVRVRAPGYAPWRGTQLVGERAEVTMLVTVRDGASLSGCATTPDGSPLAGVAVEIGQRGSFDGHRVLTDADGRYRIEGLPAGESAVQARRRDAGLAEATVPLDEGGSATWNPVLSRGRVLRGRVITRAGEAVPGVAIEVSQIVGQSTWAGLARTAMDGSFEVDNCPAGGMHLRATGRRLRPVELRAVDADQGELRIEVDFVSAATRVVGRVLGPDGMPAANAAVWLEGPYRRVAIGDTAGRFSFHDIPPGRYRMGARLEGFPYSRTAWFDLADGAEHDVGDVQVVAGGHVQVTLDRPLPDGVHVSLFDAAGDFLVGFRGEGTTLDAIYPIAPGDYRLAATGAVEAESVTTVTVRAGQTTAARLDLR